MKAGQSFWVMEARLVCAVLALAGTMISSNPKS
jgi:hypothetical protein